MITLFYLACILSFPLSNSSTDIVQRFPTPAGYERVPHQAGSFGDYLRKLPLKPKGSKVMLYNGVEKSYQEGNAAVIDMSVGKRDLQQCADAVIRLRAEFLYAQKKYEDIHFNLTNGFRVGYTKWAEGYRVMVKGNKTWWERKTTPSYSYATFEKYLTFVFSYAGTLSLSKELTPQPLSSLTSGNVFIQGGSPGHAVIVIDVAIHEKTGEKICLLAQSYMPAQDIHILKNLHDSALSPWYSMQALKELHTPEWTFNSNDLRRFSH